MSKSHHYNHLGDAPIIALIMHVCACAILRHVAITFEVGLGSIFLDHRELSAQEAIYRILSFDCTPIAIVSSPGLRAEGKGRPGTHAHALGFP